MKALVTGSTGGLGSNICKHLLEQGVAVRALMRETSPTEAIEDLDVERVVGDVTDKESLIRAADGCDWAFHTAAFISYLPSDTPRLRAVNVQGTANVIDAVRACGVKRLVHTSSIKTIAYSENSDYAPDETDDYNWSELRLVYNDSKKRAEELVQEACRDGKIDAVMCNPTIIFGERDVHNRSGKIFQAFRKGLVFYPTFGGNGVTDADDVATAHISAARKGRTGERYILNTENLIHKDYFDLGADVYGCRRPFIPLYYTPSLVSSTIYGKIYEALARGTSPFFFRDKTRLAKFYIFGDADKAKRELDFNPRPARESMAKALKWLREHGKL